MNAVWVFSGHGCQTAEMARELIALPPFAEVLDELEPVFAEEIDFSPRRSLALGRLGGSDRVHALIFVVQLGLAALLRSHGMRPAAVIGHSVGEVAAAVTAGELSPADGARLICRRSLLLRRVGGRGAMALATLGFDEVERRLAGREDVVAAVASGPRASVIAGDGLAVAEVAAAWRAERIGVLPVPGDIGFHSPQMDPLLDELVAAVSELPHRPGRLRRYSTVRTSATAAAYWAANLRGTVRLDLAVAAAAADGHRAFVEIAPHPVLAHAITDTLRASGVPDGSVTAVQRRGRPQRQTLLAALGTLHSLGAVAG
ncbi:MAG: hypothetical protein JWQ81_2528 [Amycolatopsis sp.]|uniref:acyltransferase domain-containing protein n=1 Tax=Amycolatopsis sp. TaxID=37632 RepID=UPI00261401FC|nr:acyltransferase domain-containing protein [Amycolatopsis sp.]MCU1681789.1 hypothetical protein [Amycolatopsis sp.]